MIEKVTGFLCLLQTPLASMSCRFIYRYLLGVKKLRPEKKGKADFKATSKVS